MAVQIGEVAFCVTLHGGVLACANGNVSSEALPCRIVTATKVRVVVLRAVAIA
jgi:hypothetical protein